MVWRLFQINIIAYLLLSSVYPVRARVVVGRGVTRGGQGGYNSLGAVSLRGRGITAGSAEPLWGGAENSQQCCQYFLQYNAFASECP